MTFSYDFLPDVSLDRVDSDGPRYYLDSSGNKYVSITTALAVLSKDAIDGWRERVGEKAADKIAARASSLGTSLHSIVESYLLGTPQGKIPANLKFLFNTMVKNVLDKNVTKIYGVEKKLYSKELKAAGTSDFICDFDSVASVCDLKTSRVIKSKEKIHHYFIQCGGYAVMLEELFGFDAKQIVIVMACHDDNGIVYVEDSSIWKKRARKFFALYHDGKFK